MASMVDVAKDSDQVLLFVVDILREEATLLVPNDIVRKIAEASFGCTVSGDTAVLPGIMSRKKQIIPALKSGSDTRAPDRPAPGVVGAVAIPFADTMPTVRRPRKSLKDQPVAPHHRRPFRHRRRLRRPFLRPLGLRPRRAASVSGGCGGAAGFPGRGRDGQFWSPTPPGRAPTWRRSSTRLACRATPGCTIASSGDPACAAMFQAVGRKVHFIGNPETDMGFFNPLKILENPVDIQIVPLAEADGISHRPCRSVGRSRRVPA